MLAEKFLLLLETLRSHAHDDGAPRVISTSPHIAIDLAEANASRDRADGGHASNRPTRVS